MLSSLSVSSSERKLLTLIREVGFGEMYGVEILEGEHDYVVTPTQAEHDLLMAIRNGLQHIDVLTIHNGEPTMAEVDFKDSGFRCRKKIKFPTVKTEG